MQKHIQVKKNNARPFLTVYQPRKEKKQKKSRKAKETPLVKEKLKYYDYRVLEKDSAIQVAFFTFLLSYTWK